MTDAARRPLSGARHSLRGSALLVTIIAVFVIAALAASMLATTSSQKGEQRTTVEATRALYVAEAGMSETITNVRREIIVGAGDENAPLDLAGGQYWTTAVDNGDDTATLTAWGRYGGVTRATQVIMSGPGKGVYSTSIFAGNSSGDPFYKLRFGGENASADDINGDVYSGGNLLVAGHATIEGDVLAAGNILGHADGQEGRALPAPDIRGMQYETNHDFDVAAMFADAMWRSDPNLGGHAWELPESSPAHIFRKNPDDRATVTSRTAKDDYFLEDTYESVSLSTTVRPDRGTHITLSGVGGEPGPGGSEKIYYVDGNLWIHNNNVHSFALFSEGTEDLLVTFVVKGNIYFSDNIMYQGTREDGIAFIAMKDEAVVDSGNIYFGDPSFGTLERMDAFMYAENNFLDNNLGTAGSASVTINGNMTAGNKVLINHDRPGANGAQYHTKLTVNFDERVAAEAITLPGLPDRAGAGGGWVVRSWREISPRF